MPDARHEALVDQEVRGMLCCGLPVHDPPAGLRTSGFVTSTAPIDLHIGYFAYTMGPTLVLDWPCPYG